MAAPSNSTSTETSSSNRGSMETWIHDSDEIGERQDQATVKKPLWHLSLQKAAFQGNWDIAKPIIETHGDVALYAKITPASETMLQVALSQKNCLKFVKQLLEIMTPKSLEETDRYGKTVLATAAIAGNITAARILVSLKQALPNISSHKYFGVTPLHYAAKCGHREMIDYLYSVTHMEILTGKSGLILLKIHVAASYYDKAHNLLLRFPELLLVFEEEHSQLLAEDEKWMREKAENFSVVAALILTVMFADIFTAPGGIEDVLIT